MSSCKQKAAYEIVEGGRRGKMRLSERGGGNWTLCWSFWYNRPNSSSNPGCFWSSLVHGISACLPGCVDWAEQGETGRKIAALAAADGMKYQCFRRKIPRNPIRFALRPNKFRIGCWPCYFHQNARRKLRKCRLSNGHPQLFGQVAIRTVFVQVPGVCGG